MTQTPFSEPRKKKIRLRWLHLAVRGARRGRGAARGDLALQERSLITCTVLVALGRENEQRAHFRGARNVGIPRGKLEAMITHVAHYAGWPVAATALRVLDEVWTAMDKEAKG